MSTPVRYVLLSACALGLLAAVWIYAQWAEQQSMLQLADREIETGITLFKQKRYPEALDVLENIPEGVPREWYARYYQGSTHIMLKNYESAVEHLERSLALNPTDVEIMHALGVAYYKMGNLKMSKAYFASVLEIDPTNGEARGLMEVMVNLERQQSGDEAPGANTEN